MGKDLQDMALGGGGILDQMIPLDGSWEGNTDEVVQAYAKHPDTLTNEKQLEMTLLHNEGQADGHTYQKNQQAIERSQRLGDNTPAKMDEQKLDASLQQQEDQNEQAVKDAPEHVKQLEENMSENQDDGDGE